MPTLIIHRTGDLCLKVEEGRYVASKIPGAKLVELPGNDHLPFVGDQDAILDEMEEFLTGVRHTSEPDRILATVLAIRARSPEELERNRGLIDREMEWFRGRRIEMRDGELLAAFDGPARAVRCASAIVNALARLGAAASAGLHTGECDLVAEALTGLPLKIGSSIADRANSGEVLVSSTVRDLVAGSGINFTDRDCTVQLDSGEWRLFQVT
ncbi:MAG TPA: hypothetical protein VHL58_17550 [Thermoanaerobaculia bacterium]|nr:hypothetical protein [Thermoanaerobaculia bacterium]